MWIYLLSQIRGSCKNLNVLLRWCKCKRTEIFLYFFVGLFILEEISSLWNVHSAVGKISLQLIDTKKTPTANATCFTLLSLISSCWNTKKIYGYVHSAKYTDACVSSHSSSKICSTLRTTEEVCVVWGVLNTKADYQKQNMKINRLTHALPNCSQYCSSTWSLWKYMKSILHILY